ncbi:MAG: LLM class flavin-dependent oxidoreductase, partial [Mesorhizobium sp.]
MKFSLFVHMERSDLDKPQSQLLDELGELVLLAEEAGFETAWIGEHHGMEFTISPNPFINIAYLAAKTTRIRLGTGTIIAPFWHPIKLAGEAAMTDIITGGRLDVGIARGAY